MVMMLNVLWYISKQCCLHSPDRWAVHLDVRNSSLIHGLLRNGKIQEAMQLPPQFLEKGFFPNIVTQNALINGLCKAGEIGRARELFDGVSGKILVHNCMTYAIILTHTNTHLYIYEPRLFCCV
ncbi:hypothetical protein SADUNF_Sadunf12G0083800 [Salix dunnii]|uniref:Pentatricopeptide repeat-containing protein n=1 Tax=Salix dunnii TaxID=1413687 RepID=A0A835JM97_9ROSI|nr:hypothetical protein SADUNF_Sadunf12G0083800 [Salix dunnii]